MIKPVSITNDGDEVIVNGKNVRKDMDGKWVANPPLNPSESKAFWKHIENTRT